MRLDWKGEEPPSNMHDGRAAAAPFALELKLGDDVFIPFLRRQAEKSLGTRELDQREVIQARRLLVLVESRMVSKRRSSSRKINFLLRKLGFWCLAHDIALELVWLPTWANQADAPSRNMPIESWYASLPKLLSPPTTVLASAHALSELDLHREPLSAAVHTTKEPVRKLESSGAFSCSKMKPAHVKSETSQMTYLPW